MDLPTPHADLPDGHVDACARTADGALVCTVDPSGTERVDVVRAGRDGAVLDLRDAVVRLGAAAGDRVTAAVLCGPRFVLALLDPYGGGRVVTPLGRWSRVLDATPDAALVADEAGSLDARLWWVDLATGARRQLASGARVVRGRFADPPRTCTVDTDLGGEQVGRWQVDVVSGRWRRCWVPAHGDITDAGPTVPSRVPVPRTHHRVPGPGGIRIDAWTAGSLDGDSPVVVWLHGGPLARTTSGLDDLLDDVLRAGGAVVAPNVRGSSGRGRAWAAADEGPRRSVAIRDVEAVLDWLRRPAGTGAGAVPPSRTVVAGRSYGGWLAAMTAIAFGDRVAGCATVCGVADIPTLLAGTAPHRRPHRRREYGRDRDVAGLSPLARADQLTAPLLAAHGARDSRVPLVHATTLVARTPSSSLHVEPDAGHPFHDAAGRRRIAHLLAAHAFDVTS